MPHVPQKLLTRRFYYDLIAANVDNIHLVPPEIMDREFYERALERHPQVFYELPRNLIDYRMCLFAVRTHDQLLSLIPEEYRTLEVCRAAVSHPYFAFEERYLIPEKLRSDPYIEKKLAEAEASNYAEYYQSL